MVKLRYTLYLLVLLGGVCGIGWIRYGWQVTKIYRRQAQPFVEQYMRYTLRNDNIVLSLTTTPYRIDKIQPVLDTLYKQNVKIAKIYLNLPYTFKRDGSAYTIPEWLLQNPRVTLLRTDDFGPATKLLGTLQQAKLTDNTIIITVDDDMYYPENLVLHLAYAAKKQPNKVIATIGGDVEYDVNGRIKGRGVGLKLQLAPKAPFTIPLGYAGVAYRPEFFDAQIFAIDTAPYECFMNDDFFIGFHLSRLNISRQTLDNVYVNEDDVKCYEELARQAESLYIITPNRAQMNNVCLAYLRNQYPNVNL